MQKLESIKLEKARQALKDVLLNGRALSQEEVVAVFPVDVLCALYNLLHGGNMGGYELKEVKT